MSTAEDIGREVDDALHAFTQAQQETLRAGRRLLAARRRLTEAEPQTLADVIDIRRNT